MVLLSPSDINVLIVDDNHMSRKATTLALEKLNIGSIADAEDGVSALNLLNNAEDFNLIICDLKMPNMDGMEFLRHLKAKAFTGKVIIVSGADTGILGMASELARALNLDIMGFLQKPVKQSKWAELLLNFKHEPKSSYTRYEPVCEKELADALSKNELFLVYQPKVSLKSEKPIGVEALVRWHHPEKGIISPADFIALAEQTGQINDITKHVIDLAIRQAAVWKNEGMHLKVSINLSVANLYDIEIANVIINQTKEAGLKPSDLMLEITESQLLHDITQPFEVLTRLKLNGFALAIDDYGTGYSSLSQLKRIAFSELKVDRMFVQNVHLNPELAAVLKSTIELAKQLNMSVVAEGVETKNELDHIKAAGADIAQGYYISQPQRAEEIKPWFKSFNLKV